MRVRAVLIIVALIAALCYLAWPLTYPRLHMVIDVPGATFLKPGRKLVFASEVAHAEMLPVSLDPYLIIGERPCRIEGPDDLSGHVEIRSPEAALQYARLLTGCVIAPDWIPGRAEISMESGTDLSSKADRAILDGNSSAPVPERDWRRSHLAPPTIRRVGDSFVVTRYLFSSARGSPRGTDTAYQVEETVRPDGRITRRVLDKQVLPGVRMRKPGLQ